MNTNGNHLAWRALSTVPVAVRITIGATRVSTAALRALVVVTALLPLSVLLLGALAVREAGARRALRPPGSG